MSAPCDSKLLTLCRRYHVLLNWSAILAQQARASGKRDRTIEVVLDEADAMRDYLAELHATTIEGARARALAFLADRRIDPEDKLAASVIQDFMNLTAAPDAVLAAMEREPGRLPEGRAAAWEASA